MVMTDGEIVTSYRQAKNHRAQITVLADLNNCDRAAMEAKLMELGCIRAMSDEELAQFIESQRVCQICHRRMNDCFPVVISHWLQQPAPEEGEQNV